MDYKKLIDEYLDSAIANEEKSYAVLAESMKYSLMAGGKRIRPTLCLEFAKICGGEAEKVMPAACGIEMLHTYSLIHDDLPCMDNDELRRGRATNHVVYGEYTATLAGDALQALAFAFIFKADIPAENKVRCASILADAAGYKGMCGGQYIDMSSEGKVLSEESLTELNNLKTGALLAASCAMGVAAAGGDEEHIASAMEFGYKIGLAFQIRDDMLDVLSTDAELGKSIGSDEKACKNTYMAILGEEKCREIVHKLTEEAVDILRSNFSDTEELVKFAYSLENRKN